MKSRMGVFQIEMHKPSFLYSKILWLQFHMHKKAFQVRKSDFQTRVRIKFGVCDFSSSELAGA